MLKQMVVSDWLLDGYDRVVRGWQKKRECTVNEGCLFHAVMESKHLLHGAPGGKKKK